MPAANGLQIWISQLDRRSYALAVGFGIGIVGGVIGLMIALLGPWLAIAAILGLLAGLYIITDVSMALYAIIGIALLLPFGVFPVKIAITPTLLDLALGGFLLVYLFQWMTGRRGGLRLSAVHALIALYVMWLVLAFALGLRHASPSPADIRQFAETLLSIGMVFILTDLLRNPAMLRRLVLVILLAIGLQALLAVSLYLAPDALAEVLLVRLSRIGYPAGGVIRYIEDNPALAERAIGTWVDPNALGGALATAATMIAPQIVARKPVLRWRWLTIAIFAAVAIALFLTSSRASFLAWGAGMFMIALVRYRRLLPVLLAGGLLFLFLPQTQAYLDRLSQAFQGADLATKMRIDEWTDSLELIGRYPLVGVGFTGTPEIDIYTDVANMYLMMANQIGLTGVLIFLLAMGGVFLYGRRAWRHAKENPDFAAIHLGYHAALFTGLVNQIADLYFFRLDFQSSITWFWLIVALCVASSKLALEHARKTAPGNTIA
ncbi:MAG: O-antigen ligase family protein [Chloroflexota bacterium]|nr:O-antigen ligase family protein [Chloroflexota bacterium]MDE2946601.1 O-antigen ligase family protein [Chloroflexota bacterium]